VSLSYVVLGLLEPAARDVDELKRVYDGQFGVAAPLRMGHVHHMLGQLLRDGLVVVVDADQVRPGGRRYALTPAGVACLDQWLEETERPQPRLQTVLYSKVMSAMLAGRPIGDLVRAQRERHLAARRELLEARADADGPDRLRASYEIVHIDADLQWLDTIEHSLTPQPTTTVASPPEPATAQS
jgi:DNA-binding PadR family transcriptional regulator